MTCTARRLALSVLGLVALHELCLWSLCESQLPSVLFAPGSHSPFLAAVVAVAFIGLRLGVYLVAPWILATWAADRALAALDLALYRRAQRGGGP